MKLLQQVSFIGLAILLVVTACNVEKRVYMSGYHNKGEKGKQTSVKKENVNKKKEKQNILLPSEVIKPVDETVLASTDNYFLSKKKINVNGINGFVKSSNLNLVVPLEECDIIIFKNGLELKAKVLEVGLTEIQYKLCDNINGPIISKNKSEVFMIKFPNGTHTVISSDNKTEAGSSVSESEKQIEPLSLIGFISGIAGMLIFFATGFPFLLGSAAVIMSIIGLIRIKEKPEKWKGKGFAITGLIFGILTIIFFWAYIIGVAILEDLVSLFFGF